MPGNRPLANGVSRLVLTVRARDTLPRHRNRLSSKLVAQGLRVPIGKAFLQRLEEVRLFNGRPLPAHLKAGLVREWERLQLVQEQVKALEGHMRGLIEASGALKAVRALMLLTGVSWVGAVAIQQRPERA